MESQKIILVIAVHVMLQSTLAQAGDVEFSLPGAADAFTVDQPAGTERMRVHGDGNVGIGTSVFNSGIFGSGTHLGQQILHDDGTAVLSLESYRDSGNHSKVWATANRGTQASPLPLNSGDFILELNASAFDGTSFDNAARIALGVDNNGTVTPGTSMPGKIVFRTSPDGSKGDVERMRIDSAGKVGIGTASPQLELDVINSGSNYSGIGVSTRGAGGANINLISKRGESWGAADQKNWQLATYADDRTDGFENMLDIDFWDGSATPVRTNVMRLTSVGDVGIGTTNPQAKLEIAGERVLVSSSGSYAETRYQSETKLGDWSVGTGGAADDGFYIFDYNAASVDKNRLYIDSVGNVRIGGVTGTPPTSKLDVAGNIKVADEGMSCDADREGQIRYEATLKKHQGCDGSSWNNLY